MYIAINHRTNEEVTHSNYEMLLRVLYETSEIGDTYTIDFGQDQHDIMVMAAGIVKLDWIYINA